MRAAVFKGAGTPLVVERVEDPVPGAGEAVIRVGRCGICGTDIHMTSGHASDFPVGTVMGHEYAGEVVAIGKGVTRVRPGDIITAMPAKGCGACGACLAGFPLGCAQMQGFMGGFGEFLRVAETSAVVLPAGLTVQDGALVEPLAVGLRGVTLGRIERGQRVLVLGAGSVGLAAIHWARLSGAGRVVAASPSMRRKAMALAIGADAFETLGDGEGERIDAALGGPPEMVFECTGAVGTLQKSIDLVAIGGTVVSLGFCLRPDPIQPWLATWKRITIRFSYSYDLADFAHCVDMMDRGHVEPRSMISETVGLEALPAMLEAIRGGAAQTKVHVDPWAETPA